MLNSQNQPKGEDIEPSTNLHTGESEEENPAFALRYFSQFCHFSLTTDLI